jgi:uncharacterized protein (DUF927 family)
MKSLFRTFCFLFILFWSLNSFSQNNDRFEEFKKMKLNFILTHTNLNEEEKEVFNSIFTDFENRYHSKVWILQRNIRKDLSKTFDTISSKSASKYIEDYYQFEQLGMTMKNERNQKLLKSIRPKEVLHILHQEKEFDQEMFRRIRNRSKEKEKK